MIALTNRQARQFMLLKHGLLGQHKFIGKQGALDFVRQAGCIQFDPVDSCGKNAELTLQSRVKGFSKETLAELLYSDRSLVDYPDKNLSIIPTENWPYFQRYRQAALSSGLQFDGLSELEEEALAYIEANGPVSSDELPFSGRMHWHSSIHWSGNWSGETNAARAVLEQLYSTGKLVIHHKKGARKYYDLAQRHIPTRLLLAPDPLPVDEEHFKWRVLRRIGAVGLLWNRPSDAWLNIWNMKSPQRDEAFYALLLEGKIQEVQVAGIKHTLYCKSEDLALINTVLQNNSASHNACDQDLLQHNSYQGNSSQRNLCGRDLYRPRCELIAPLDCMMWDRKLIKALFDFDYTWEIYTPAHKRKYGFYVLPLLYGEKFVGQVEAVADHKTDTLIVKNIWYEEGMRQTKKLETALSGCLKRLAKFNHCHQIV